MRSLLAVIATVLLVLSAAQGAMLKGAPKPAPDTTEGPSAAPSPKASPGPKLGPGDTDGPGQRELSRNSRGGNVRDNIRDNIRDNNRRDNVRDYIRDNRGGGSFGYGYVKVRGEAQHMLSSLKLHHTDVPRPFSPLPSLQPVWNKPVWQKPVKKVRERDCASLPQYRTV